MVKRTVSSRISQDVVNLLVDRGMSLTQIAQTLDVSKSFISRVKAGTRSLTLDHLSELERKVRRPLPLLLMEAIPRHAVSRKLLPLYDATISILRQSEAKRLRSKVAKRPRSRAKAA